MGCTGRTLRTRFSEHVGTATQQCHINTNKPVGAHFRLPGHSQADMRVVPIEKVRSSDKMILEARESFWIQKYKAVKQFQVDHIEHGLNLKG